MLQYWIKKPHILILVACTLTFLLGTSIADYLGNSPIVWKVILGILTVWAALGGSQYLFEYFEKVSAGGHPFGFRKDIIEGGSPSPQTLLISFVVMLTLALAIGLGLIQATENRGLSFLLLALLLISTVLFVGQPRLVYSGYGELMQGLVCCCLVPAFAFSIQTGEIHPLFLPVTYPLVFIFIAVRLAMELDSYASDIKWDRRTLLLRLSWQRGVWFHHMLLLIGYIFLASAPLMGVAWRLVWPALLMLAGAVVEIWLVNRIALGLPPRWALLKFTAWMVFLLTVYILVITFWMI